GPCLRVCQNPAGIVINVRGDESRSHDREEDQEPGSDESKQGQPPLLLLGNLRQTSTPPSEALCSARVPSQARRAPRALPRLPPERRLNSLQRSTASRTQLPSAAPQQADHVIGRNHALELVF